MIDYQKLKFIRRSEDATNDVNELLEAGFDWDDAIDIVYADHHKKEE